MLVKLVLVSLVAIDFISKEVFVPQYFQQTTVGAVPPSTKCPPVLYTDQCKWQTASIKRKNKHRNQLLAIQETEVQEPKRLTTENCPCYFCKND